MKVHEPVMVDIHGQNSGKTAARMVKGVGITEILKGRREPDFQYVKGHPRSAFEGAILDPNGFFDFQVFTMKEGPVRPTIIPLTQSVLDEINSGKAKLFVHGEITYRDAFKRGHWVKYCFVYVPSGYVPGDIPHFGIPHEGVCKDHNDMDEN